MPWRTSWEIGLAELGAGSIVPASGAGGLALGAWILREGGMPAQRIASRSVAFFLITRRGAGLGGGGPLHRGRRAALG